MTNNDKDKYKTLSESADNIIDWPTVTCNTREFPMVPILMVFLPHLQSTALKNQTLAVSDSYDRYNCFRGKYPNLELKYEKL